MIGSEQGERFGLTFKHDLVLRHMINKWNWNGDLDFSTVLLRDIYPELIYEDNEHQCIWDKDDILDSLRILDSIRFKRVDIIKTTKAFPLIMKRENIAVYVAPRMLQINGILKIPATDYHSFDLKRDSRNKKTEYHSLNGSWKLARTFIDDKLHDESIECNNCGMQFYPPDYYERMKTHPDCVCMCDCEQCVYARSVMEYMKEVHDLPHYRKKLNTKN